MRGRGDDVGVLEGGGDDARGDETGDVGHVDYEVGAAVRRGAGDDDLGPIHHGIVFEGFVVDDASVEVDPVGEGFEVGGYCGNPR